MYIVRYPTDDLGCYNYYWMCPCPRCKRMNYMAEYSEYCNYGDYCIDYRKGHVQYNVRDACGMNAFTFDVSVYKKYDESEKYINIETTHDCDYTFDIDIRDIYDFDYDIPTINYMRDNDPRALQKMTYYNRFCNGTFSVVRIDDTA